MSKMGWIHQLVKQAYSGNPEDITKLEDELSSYGFKNSRFAAKEFIKAYTELEGDGEPTTADEYNEEWINDPDDGSWKGR